MWLVAILLSAWSTAFVWSSSFIVDGERYFCLFDDAMISMTYARNLVEGFGLNWARWGSPVEGYSNPLWTLVMLPVNLVPLPLPMRSLLMQGVGLLCLLGNLWLVGRLTARFFCAGGAGLHLPAVILTALYYPLAYWTLLGMETGLQALLTTGAVYLSLEIGHADGRRHVTLCLVLAFLLLLRPDTAPLSLACLATAVDFRAPWRRELARWRRGLVLLICLPLAYQVFRLVYFGDWLPNTYYLKLTGVPVDVRVVRGALVFWGFLRPILLPAGAVLVCAGLLSRRNPLYRLPLAAILIQFGYSVSVGGDAWESAVVGANRFIAPVMPLLFVLLTGVLNEIIDRWPALGRLAGLRVAGVVAVVLVAACWFDRFWLDPRSSEMRRAVFLVDVPWSAQENRVNLQHVRALQEAVADEALVASVWAGVPSYFSSFRMIDILGYNDRQIARMPAALQLTRATASAFTPGHNKWDWEYVLAKRPDAILRGWALNKEARQRLFGSRGYVRLVRDIWVRSDSERLRARPSP
jgi:hypothetical protein